MKQKSILTSIDIASLINAMKLVFPTREEVRQMVKDETKHLPSKDDFFTRMDKLSGEIQKVRDEQTLHQGQHDEINTKLERHDKRILRTEHALKLPPFAD
ncbi:hypothetical protein HY950_03350 [Candidatus Gottesmanbacteria bacterium]|nr:hypothetical protein [Candidatus Gottesmanbacteria bacterium]